MGIPTIGKVNYGSKKKQFKIEDGSNVFAIMPPMGKLAAVGKYMQYYNVEWGHKNSKGQNKPFQDVRVVNRKTKMVEVESAAFLHREQLKAQKDQWIEYHKQIKQLFDNKQATTQQLSEAEAGLKQYTDLVKQYNLEKKYYINVMNLKGEIGLLKIGSDAKKALAIEIENVKALGYDPIGMTGVFFNFNRSNPTGQWNDTTYTVTAYRENVQAVINGQNTVVQQIKTYDLTNILERLGQEAWELADMYPVFTPEQVERIVTGGPAAVDAVFAEYEMAKSANEPQVQNTVQAPVAPTLQRPAMPNMISAPTMPMQTMQVPASMAASNTVETVQIPVMPLVPTMPAPTVNVPAPTISAPVAPAMPSMPAPTAPVMPTTPVVNSTPATTPVVPKAPTVPIINPNVSDEEFLKMIREQQ